MCMCMWVHVKLRRRNKERVEKQIFTWNAAPVVFYNDIDDFLPKKIIQSTKFFQKFTILKRSKIKCSKMRAQPTERATQMREQVVCQCMFNFWETCMCLLAFELWWICDIWRRLDLNAPIIQLELVGVWYEVECDTNIDIENWNSIARLFWLCFYRFFSHFTYKYITIMSVAVRVLSVYSFENYVSVCRLNSEGKAEQEE